VLKETVVRLVHCSKMSTLRSKEPS
jgi:hypothetical protein